MKQTDAASTSEETMERFYFTFGYDHAHPRGYVVIDAEDWDAARGAMFDRFGREWAFQYDEATWRPARHGGLTLAEKHGLHEVDTDQNVSLSHIVARHGDANDD